MLEGRLNAVSTNFSAGEGNDERMTCLPDPGDVETGAPKSDAQPAVHIR